jgi:hypothetical protein
MNLTRINKVTIIGTLESINLIRGNSPKAGNFIRGDVVVRVNLPKPMSIPLQFFSSALDKEGKPRKLHGQLELLRTGSRVSFSATIADNKFWDPSRGQLVKTKRLNLLFINPVKMEDPDTAEFTYSGFIAETIKEKVDKDGNLEAYTIKVGQSDYQGTRAEIITFNIDPRNNAAVSYITREYTKQRTVELFGDLDYDVQTITVEEPVDFGKPVVKTYQRNISNLLITSGKFPDEGTYEATDIANLIAGDEADDARIQAEAKNKEQSGKEVSEKKPSANAVNSSLL